MHGASILGLLLLALPAHAQDAERGRLLYETYCGDCHYERVHERAPDRSKVHTLSDLRTTVASWAPMTKLKFTPADVDDVAEYLNRSHYKMAK
ncbi:MAG: cytochrome c [Acidobacteriia bacterium]|nr:cytochrome c [Terriglobia bacterium]